MSGRCKKDTQDATKTSAKAMDTELTQVMFCGVMRVHENSGDAKLIRRGSKQSPTRWEQEQGRSESGQQWQKWRADVAGHQRRTYARRQRDPQTADPVLEVDRPESGQQACQPRLEPRAQSWQRQDVQQARS